MKIPFTLFLVLCLLAGNYVSAQMQFVSPLPGSADHNPERNIIIRDGALIDAASINKKNLFSIVGSISGKHDFELVLCRDQRTIILNPLVPFTEGEKVTATVGNSLRRTDGTFVKPASFSFSIHRTYTQKEKERIAGAREQEWEEEFGRGYADQPAQKKGPNAGASLPPMYITTNTNPSPGEIFFHNYNFYGYETYHHCIMTNNGDSIYSSGSNVRGWDFKINKNGYLSMYYKFPAKFQLFDSSLIYMGNFSTKNGYITDIHDFQIFPDGHYYVQGYSYTFMDLTVYDPSYHPNASITGLVIQKFDKDKNMLFEWRSLDHIPVIEAPHATFTSSKIDYVHGNSIEEDVDGNIIISCRHLDQVNKIDVNTGEFIWRLGGVKNEFALVNDSIWFTYQHDARRLPNGNLTLFDNGNFHGSLCSYAREYHLDEVNKIATAVWTYKHPQVNGQNVYGSALGSVQRLSNGNTLINWGAILPDKEFPNLTEVTPDNEIVWEMRLKDTYNDVIYRAHKYEWNPCPRPLSANMKTKEITSNSAILKWTAANGASEYKLQHRKIGESNWLNKTIDDGTSSKTLNNLIPGTGYEWHVQTICSNGMVSTFTDVATFNTLPQKSSGNIMPAAGIEIYPNPATNNIQVKMLGELQQSITVEILNVLGVSVSQSHFESFDIGQPLTIDISRVSAGSYLLLVHAGEQHWLEKIVVE